MNAIKEKVRDLWQNCFDDSEDFMNLYFSTKYSDENTLVKELTIGKMQMVEIAKALSQNNDMLGERSSDILYFWGFYTTRV
mgnify:CR=1 FL=1